MAAAHVRRSSPIGPIGPIALMALIAASPLHVAPAHAAPAHAAPAHAAKDADPALVDEGRYLVTAGDCAGCHGESLAGGEPIDSPMGSIYASNITPDPAAGIGGWSFEQFEVLMRRGEAPGGHIYPAMPYTSYTGLRDEELRAIWSYLRLGVEPVAKPAPETHLPFPFARPAMIAWNALFLDEGRPTGAIDVDGERLQRGRLLVESLGHCSGCHSPRGALMQQDPEHHLGGGMIGGWWAPNITSDDTGIGGWSDARLATFLRSGHTDEAVAAGEMGTVVSRSLSRLSPGDIGAIIGYLRAVPPVTSKTPLGPSAPEPVRVVDEEPATDAGWQAMLGHDTERGDELYRGACATCHGLDGTGSSGLERPSLRRVDGVVAPEGATLVQVIAHGVDRRVGAEHAFMPGFGSSLDDEQIAALANYVRTTFAGVPGDVDAAGVKRILAGTIDTPWPIANARGLALAGMAFAGLLVVLAVAWPLVRSRRRAAGGSSARGAVSSRDPVGAPARGQS